MAAVLTPPAKLYVVLFVLASSMLAAVAYSLATAPPAATSSLASPGSSDLLGRGLSGIGLRRSSLFESNKGKTKERNGTTMHSERCPPPPPQPSHEERQRVDAARKAKARKMERDRQEAERQPPEIVQLRELLQSILASTHGTNGTACRWDALIAIGDMYHRGGYPRFLPDPDAASECYKIAAMCPDGQVAGVAQMKYMEARLSPIKKEDCAGAPMPYAFCRDACRAAQGIVLRTPSAAFQRPSYPKKQNERRAQPGGEEEEARAARPVHHPVPIPVYDIRGNVMGETADAVNGEEGILQRVLHEQALGARAAAQRLPLRFAPPRRPPPLAVGVPAFRHDGQNVHDHGITTATDYNLRRLREEEEQQREEQDNQRGDQKLTPREEAKRRLVEEQREEARVKEARDGIIACPDISPRQKADALHVLDGLNKTHLHSSYNATERQALATVWDKINRSEYRDNLTETLAKQLASGVEYGSTVCSSGKIARIVSTLDGTENEAAPRPMWAVREEIGSIAAKVREDEDGKDEEDQKRAFAERVHDEYVNKLGMNEGIIDGIVNEYSMGF